MQLKVYTFEFDSLGRMVSKIVLLRLCASISTKMTDQAAPCSPNKLQPFTASSAAFAMPIKLKKTFVLVHKLLLLLVL